MNKLQFAAILTLVSSLLHGGNTFQNPIITGFHPDPSVCRVGEDYYLVNSTFEYFPAIPVFHSRDLVNWKQIGNVLDRDEQVDLSKRRSGQGLYAPTIRHHDGLFYALCTVVGGKGGFIATAKDPAGPWSKPHWLGDHQIDNDLFWDDDGRAYYTACEGGEKGGIAQAEIDPKTLKFKTKFKRIWEDPLDTWDEGPHLYKINGKYYLLAAVGGTGDRHKEIVARSDKPDGPFEDAPQPFLTHRDRKGHPIQSTGHADLFQAHDGSWWTVFLGTRDRKGYTALGRESFLAPVTWTKEGWPVAGKNHHVEMEMKAPAFYPGPADEPQARESFDTKKLGPQWLHVRNPAKGAHRLLTKKGVLRLRGTANAPGDVAPMAWAGKRVKDHHFTARTRMRFEPERDGEEAGLNLRGSDQHFLSIAMTREGGETRLVARHALKGASAVLASVPVDAGQIFLEAGGDEEHAQVSWSLDGEHWEALATIPIRQLQYIFTGLAVGMYATGNGKKSKSPADFSWFEMHSGKAPVMRPVTPRPTPTPLPTRPNWRICAGGKGLMDSRGRRWLADIGYDDGEIALTGSPIEGTEDSALYQAERYGQDFSYRLAVPEGSYQVTLHFAETYVSGPGERVFSVWINGSKKLDHLDVLKKAGGKNKALVEKFSGIQPGKDGNIVIRFEAHVQNAKICAIEVSAE